MDFNISPQTKGYLLAKYHLRKLDSILYSLVSPDGAEDEAMQDRLDKPLIELRKTIDELIINSINDNFDAVSFSGII